MIYLIGTRHDLQYTGASGRGTPEQDRQSRNELKAFLLQKAQEHDPSLIAEEMSQYVLDIKSAQSNVKAVADCLHIEHRFCDPDCGERTRLGISSFSSDELSETEKNNNCHAREKYWLDQIRDRIESSIIFVCGADHVESFGKMLKSVGIEISVLHPDLCGAHHQPLSQRR